MNRYVINLDRSPERLARMRAMFEAMDLDFRRVAAVDGNALSSGEIANLTRPKSDGMPWTAQEVGIALSQLNCWKLIAEGDEKFAAVFEDDIYFSSDAHEFVREYDWVPDFVDVVKLETCSTKVKIKKSGITTGSRIINRLLSNHWGSGGYILSKEFAGRLVDEIDGKGYFSDQSDVMLFTQPSDVEAYQLVPAICIQDLTLRGADSVGYLGSTLEAERVPLRRRSKPHGWPKVRREVGRPFFRMEQTVRDLLQPLFGRRSVRIPMRW
jgi:glycosyl transferase family 25